MHRSDFNPNIACSLSRTAKGSPVARSTTGLESTEWSAPQMDGKWLSHDWIHWEEPPQCSFTEVSVRLAWWLIGFRPIKTRVVFQTMVHSIGAEVIWALLGDPSKTIPRWWYNSLVNSQSKDKVKNVILLHLCWADLDYPMVWSPYSGTWDIFFLNICLALLKVLKMVSRL